MIGYITLGTNNLQRACTFYDELLSVIGISQLWKTATMAAWGPSRDEPALCVTVPYDSNEATVGNGVMVALKVAGRGEVDALHTRALELGASDEGAPGPRGTSGFYAGYFRDADGNKLNAYTPVSKIPEDVLVNR